MARKNHIRGEIMSMHDGHRERLKNRYREEGLDHFAPVNVLEMLLFYCIPRKNTNPIAHRLLDHFGTIEDVLNADPKELVKIEGISENSALFLTMLPDVLRYYRKGSNKVRFARTTEEYSRYLADYFVGHTDEIAFLLCLDGKCKILSCKEVGRGNINSAAISVRKIVETALNVKASTVVLAHNHPSGLAIPSGEDVRTTRKLASALRAVDVILSDHLVFSDGECVSMLHSGYFDPSIVE